MSAITEEQEHELTLVYDSAMKLLSSLGSVSRARNLRFSPEKWDMQAWSQICEVGWPGLLLAADRGGSAAGMRSYAKVARAAGAHLLPEPLVGVVLAAGILDGSALHGLLQGNRLILPAWQDQHQTLADTSRMTLVDGSYVSGCKRFIYRGMQADAYLVLAGDEFMLVETSDTGVSRQHSATQDGGHFCTLKMDHATILAKYPSCTRGIEEATVAQAAYLLGVAEAAFSMTLKYLCTREQFGRPIGSFQALQHRAADMKIQLALAEAAMEGAAAMLEDNPSIEPCLAAVSRAKARCNDVAMLVTREAVQMHGAIGYTDEYDVGLYLRSAMTHIGLYGSSALHRARYGTFLK
jgi:alkylation response protein AidB-like acyl-CoA dehydrogenase